MMSKLLNPAIEYELKILRAPFAPSSLPDAVSECVTNCGAVWQRQGSPSIRWFKCNELLWLWKISAELWLTLPFASSYLEKDSERRNCSADLCVMDSICNIRGNCPVPITFQCYSAQICESKRWIVGSDVLMLWATGIVDQIPMIVDYKYNTYNSALSEIV